MTKLLKFLNRRSPVLNSSVVVKANAMGNIYQMDNIFTTEITRCYLIMWFEQKLIHYQRKITYLIKNLVNMKMSIDTAKPNTSW